MTLKKETQEKDPDNKNNKTVFTDEENKRFTWFHMKEKRN